jgi:cell division transport system ATP-binding protein
MIRFDSVTKLYRGAPRPALDGVSLEIGSGEFVFLVGASGSGKSSLLRLMLREEKPTTGEIHVLGQRLTSISNRKVPYFRRSLGVVFQDFRLLPNKTVHDNVAFTLQVIGKSRGFIQEAVPHVLSLVGLSEKAGNFPNELSGGEQQRVAIARAAVNKPAILLADEPTGNLDPNTSAGIMQVLELINASGTTVVMATHDVSIVDRMQKRVVELVGGRIIRDEEQAKYVTSALPVQDLPDVASDDQPGFVPVWARTATGPVAAPSVVPNRVAGDVTTGPVRTGTGPVPLFRQPEPEVQVEAPAAALHPQPYQQPSMPAPAYEAPAASVPFAPQRPAAEQQPYPPQAQPYATEQPYTPQPFAARASAPQPQAEQRPAPAARADEPGRERMDLRHAPAEQVPVWARDEPVQQPDVRRREARDRGSRLTGAIDTPGFGTELFTAPRHPDGSPGRGLDEDLAMTTGRWSLGETRPVTTIPPDIGNTGDPDGIIRRVGRHRTPAMENLDFVTGLGLRSSGQDDEVGPSS